MNEAGLIAIISVSGTALIGIINSLFHGSSLSRCKKIDCCFFSCDREVLSEEN